MSEQVIINSRESFFSYVANFCGDEPDYPFADSPETAVLRHPGNRKWYALVMELPVRLLGRIGNSKIDAVNLKCDPVLIDSLLSEPGFFPAYHMNKTHWITIALDGSADSAKLAFVLNLSYDLTAPKAKRKHP